MKKIALTITIFFNMISFQTLAVSKNVMAPLQVKDFSKFDKELKKIKELGAHAVSTDVWWGLIEKEDGKFDWSHYQKLSDIIISNGLQWVPILSFHQCGGNVGDNCNIPIPSWLWNKYSHLDIAYKSEQGNTSREVISAYATPYVISEYKDVFSSFKESFKNKIHNIQEINISLGPAGELRYPSYNSHDKNSGYPTRGSLQSYSKLAIKSFQKYITNKYKNINNLNSAWGFGLKEFKQVFPPSPELFFPNSEQNSPYGRDFYDWYALSLREHGRLILTEGIATFREYGLAIGAKIPGIHWRMAYGADRLAELNAGLINPRQELWNDDKGHGYSEMIKLFSGLKKSQNYNNLILHFTCLEKDNGEQGSYAMSDAKSLVYRIGHLAKKEGVEIKGENALAGPMQSQRSWDNIQDALIYGNYSGITILRIGDVLKSHLSRDNFYKLH